MRRFDVVAIGEGLVEFNQTRPGEPNYLQGFGGDTSNAVIAAARAGARTAYLSRVGGDAFGSALLDLWRREGVDTGAVETDAEAPTGLYFVTHGAHGHEFAYRRTGSAASRMSEAWLHTPAAAAVLHAAALLHVSGITLALSGSARHAAFAAMRLVREAGGRVAFDSNLRLKLWPLEAAAPAIEQAIALCDIFLPSLEDITALTGLTDPDQVLDWGHACGAGIVALKLGGHGTLVSDGTGRERIPALRVKAVDATGAGDCFAGNFLARLSLGDSLVQAARYANAAAAVAVQGFGAVAPLPRPEQVKALL